MVSVDGLSGFPEAIQTFYLKARVRLCIVHLVRAAMRYALTADSPKVVAELKKICQADTVAEEEQELDNFASTWSAKYPNISRQWHLKWPHITAMYKMPRPTRKAMYDEPDRVGEQRDPQVHPQP